MPTLSSFAVSLACAAALAGGPAPGASGDPLRDPLRDPSGTWAGRLETPRLAARIELALQRAGTEWTGGLTAHAPRELRSPAVGIALDGDRLRFQAGIAEADVAFEGRVSDGLVVGEITVSEGGRVFERGHFGLARREDGRAGEERVDRFLASHSLPLDEAERDQALAALDRLLRTKYVFPDVGARVADEIGALALAGEQSSAGFASRLTDELFARSRDPHLKVKCAGQPVADPDRVAVETRAEREELRETERADNFGIRSAEILPGNVGLLDLRRLVRADLSGDTLAAAMAFLANADALILDLRECGGGHPSLGLVLISYLVDGLPQRISDLHRRPENEIAQLWTLPWVAGARRPDREVYVLTAARTFSAAEALAFDLRALKRATLVGERTGGGAHAGRWYPLGEHFAAFVPTTRVASALVEGDWEGQGVVPDVEVAAEDALTRARELVLEGRIARACDPGRRAALELELEALRR